MKNEFIKFTDEDVSFYIQFVSVKDEDNGGDIIQDASSYDETVEKKISYFQKSLLPLKHIAKSFIDTAKMISNQPDEVELETNIAFTQGGSLVFFKADVETTFKVKLKWKKQENPLS